MLPWVGHPQFQFVMDLVLLIDSEARIRYYLILLCIGVGCHLKIQAQAVPIGSDTELEEAIVDALELKSSLEEDQQADYSAIIRDLNELKDDPVNINTTGQQEQRLMGFLSEMQVFSLVAYRETYGELVSIYELQAIDGFDYLTIQRILPFVKVASDPPDQRIQARHVVSYGKHKLLIRVQRILEERKGYSSSNDPLSNYLGSPERYFLRYGYNFRNRLRIGFTAEKDPGETFQASRINDTLSKMLQKKVRSGFDFYSFYFFLNRPGIVNSLIVGDYQLNFGQGLTIGMGHAMRGLGDIVAIRKMQEGIRPHTGSDENRFFRGVAISLARQRLRATLFISRNSIDAGQNVDTISSQGGFASKPTFTGNHRTINELLKRNTLDVTATGSRLSLRGQWFKVGITASLTAFDNPVALKDQLYGTYELSGSKNYNVGFDYHIRIRGISFFGELAMGRNGALAMIHGMVAAIHPRLSMSLMVRDYRRDYQNFFSNAFSAGHTYNEQGIYAGVRMLLAAKMELLTHIDLYRQPWISYLKDRPTLGRDASVSLNFRNGEHLLATFRVRHSDRQRNNTDSPAFFHPLKDVRKTGFRLQADYKTSPSVSMRNRIEYVITGENSTPVRSGFVVLQDVCWKNKNENLNVKLRYALFETDTYEERIYAYEYDVLYAFSVPAYYGRGTRGLALLKVKLSGWMNMWFRVSRTWFTDRHKIGTGNEEIQSNAITELKLQVQMKIR